MFTMRAQQLQFSPDMWRGTDTKIINIPWPVTANWPLILQSTDKLRTIIYTFPGWGMRYRCLPLAKANGARDRTCCRAGIFRSREAMTEARFAISAGRIGAELCNVEFWCDWGLGTVEQGSTILSFPRSSFSVGGKEAKNSATTCCASGDKERGVVEAWFFPWPPATGFVTVTHRASPFLKRKRHNVGHSTKVMRPFATDFATPMT